MNKFFYTFGAGALGGWFGLYFYAIRKYNETDYLELLSFQAIKAIPFLTFLMIALFLLLFFYYFKRLFDQIFMEGQVEMCKKIKDAEIAISTAVHTADDYRNQTLKQTEQERVQIIHRAKTEANRIRLEALPVIEQPFSQRYPEKQDRLAGSRGKSKRLEDKIEKYTNKI